MDLKPEHKKEVVYLHSTGDFYESLKDKIIYWDYNRGGGRVVVGFGDKKIKK